MFPCILNGKENEHSVIQAKEESGELDYISADYCRAELLQGLEESQLAKSFLEIMKPLDNIKKVVDTLHQAGISCIVITVGPKQVAKVASDIWGFDGYYGSDYEIENGTFTGQILDFVQSENKIDCLQDFCLRNQITRDECIAVGDGTTDIPLFEYCVKSIAINAPPEVKRKATHYLNTNDLFDIIRYINF